MSIRFLGTGSYVPEKTVTNDDLAMLVDTSDEWIMQRVGVKERHVSTGQTAEEFAVIAAQRALESANVKASELDLIVAATISAECVCPTVAGFVQRAIGAACPAFDVNSACSGFLFALETAAAFISHSAYKKVLVMSYHSTIHN